MSIYPSGDKTLDLLLTGWFRQDLIYLVYGNRKIITDILLQLSVDSFKKYCFEKKVVFIDENNRFYPYHLSKSAKEPIGNYFHRIFYKRTINEYQDYLRKYNKDKVSVHNIFSPLSEEKKKP